MPAVLVTRPTDTHTHSFFICIALPLCDCRATVICNFNVYILMFVINFLFWLNSLDLTFIGFTFL